MNVEKRRLDAAALEILLGYSAGWTVLLDEQSRIVYEHGSRDAIFGGPGTTSSIGRRIAAFVHPDDLLLAVDRMEESLSKPGSEVRFEIRAGLAETGYGTVDVQAVNRFDHPRLNGVIVSVTARTKSR